MSYKPFVIAAVSILVLSRIANAQDLQGKVIDRRSFEKQAFRPGTSFEGAQISSCNFTESKLIEANFRGASIKAGAFGWADMSKADFRGAKFSNDVGFSATILDGANLEGVDLSECRFSVAKFRGANLRNLKGIKAANACDFSGADVRGADLSQMSWGSGGQPKFAGALYDSRTKWPLTIDPNTAGAKRMADAGPPANGPEPKAVAGNPAGDGPNPLLDPTFGAVKLTANFQPDPHSVDVVSGGPIQTNLGGVNAFVAKNPDYRIVYTAGQFPLTFHVMSTAKTTLLINLPNGQWIANGDANPSVRLAAPPSGQYDVYVGSTTKEGAKARLHITEIDLKRDAGTPQKGGGAVVVPPNPGNNAGISLPGTYWQLLSMTQPREKITDASNPADVEYLKDGKWGVLHYGGRREAGTYTVTGDRLMMKTEDKAEYHSGQMRWNPSTRILEIDSGNWLMRLRRIR